MAISKPRNRVVLFRLTQDEYAQVQRACTEVDARSVSDFARARILGHAAPGAMPAQVEARLADLTHAVERLTRLVEARAESSAAFAAGPYLAKSGD